MSHPNPFFKQNANSITCLLCQHYCQLKEGQTGICGVNKNKKGILENLVYGKVSAINIDPIEKKPLYHFLPSSMSLSIGTVGCNFKCPFCQNWQISQTSDASNAQNVTPKQLVKLAKEHHCQSISYTYNEPTIFYPFAKDVALLAKQEGIKNIFVSNGFESPEILEDMVGVIDAFNIDLKSFQSDYYKKHLKGSLEGVLKSLRTIKKRGFWLEVTTLIVPNQNDSQEELRQIATFIAQELGVNTPWHISAFYPNYKERHKEPTPLTSLENAYALGKEAGLNHIYMGNIGKENPTLCPSCQEVLIERVGFRVSKNIINQGRCPKCNTTIEGVWK